MHTLGEAYRGAPIVPFSAKTGSGKEDLWRQILNVVSDAMPAK
jgi:hypothetical protein